jgi:hypothetical protein
VAVLTTELAHMEAVQSENARLRDALARAQERGAVGVARVATRVDCVETGTDVDRDGNLVEAQHVRDIRAYDEMVAHQLVIRSRMQQLLEAAGVSVAAVTCASRMAALIVLLR